VAGWECRGPEPSVLSYAGGGTSESGALEFEDPVEEVPVTPAGGVLVGRSIDAEARALLGTIGLQGSSG
jgi:hypothetical protein